MSWADSTLGTIVLLGAGAAVGTVLGLLVRAADWAVRAWRRGR